MPITGKQRFDLHAALRRVLGEELGDVMIEHLPPVGWVDVALSRDIVAVRGDIDSLRRDVIDLKSDVRTLRSDVNELRSDLNELRSDVNGLKSDVNELKSDVRVLKSDMRTLRTDLDTFRTEIRGELHRELSGIRSSIRVLTGAMITIAVAMLGVMVQINLSIAQL